MLSQPSDPHRLGSSDRLSYGGRRDLAMKAIMYHYVRPAPDGLPYFRYLHVDDFARQLDWFAAHYGFVTYDAFLEARETGRVPKGVLLTFDDGLCDHYKHVFPLLVERGLLGFFYISTAPYSTGRLLDVHRIHLYLGRLGGQRALERLSQRIDESMLGHGHVEEFREATYTRQDNDHATTAFKRTLNYFISYRYRREILDELFAEEFGDEREMTGRFYLTHDEIREMDASGMVIGSHGLNHYVFSKLPVDEQRDEIAQSFADLSRITGRPVRTFCYPYGGLHTFTPETVTLLNGIDSRYAFNVEPRDITAADLKNAPQALPRYDCNMFPHGKASLGADKARQAASARLTP
jgi:peptidoglycan/xylan/chitin deacetylase (PgdA/CDA1 family)